jgi:hypothetical protein
MPSRAGLVRPKFAIRRSPTGLLALCLFDRAL